MPGAERCRWRPSEAPRASGKPRPGLRLPIDNATLLTRERENGCIDASGAPPPQSWPDWADAHIAGGDVPPARVVSDQFKDPASGLVWPAGVAINPANHEVYTIDSVSNAMYMFRVPELFRMPPAVSTGANR
jgi:hypothetical protein